MHGECDGRSITVDSGTYQLENVSRTKVILARLMRDTLVVKAEGSEINYKPPYGTSEVIYEFNVFVTNKDDNGLVSFSYSLWMNDGANDVKIGKGTYHGHLTHCERRVNLKCKITIGDIDDYLNSKIRVGIH